MIIIILSYIILCRGADASTSALCRPPSTVADRAWLHGMMPSRLCSKQHNTVNTHTYIGIHI